MVLINDKYILMVIIIIKVNKMVILNHYNKYQNLNKNFKNQVKNIENKIQICQLMIILIDLKDEKVNKLLISNMYLVINRIINKNENYLLIDKLINN